MAREDAFMLIEDELLLMSSRGPFTLDVITGNSEGMKRGVIDVCERYGFDYYTSAYNMGVITIMYQPI